MATSIICATPQIQRPNRSFSSIVQSFESSPFDRTQKSPFENYTTLKLIVLDFTGDSAIFLALHRTFQVAVLQIPPPKASEKRNLRKMLCVLAALR
jgi:hypothetical protein